MLYLQSHVNRTVKVPRPYFWKRLKAFDKIQTLLPKTIKEVKIPENFSNSPGDVRYVYLEKVYHGEVIERLDGFIEEKFMTYSVIDKSCLPVENYVSTVNIKKTNQNYTILYSLDGYDEISLTNQTKVIQKDKELLSKATESQEQSS